VNLAGNRDSNHGALRKIYVVLARCCSRDIINNQFAKFEKNPQVPGCSFVWNTLLTKKLPMFLPRLNEINGGCKKILPVSGSF